MLRSFGSLEKYQNMDSETLKLLINEIAEQSGVPEHMLCSPTLDWQKKNPLLVIIGASSLIVLACSLVIYSLFSIFLLSGKHMNMADYVCWGLHQFRLSVSCEESFVILCCNSYRRCIGKCFGLLFRPGRLALDDYTGMYRCDCPCYRNCLENCCPYPCKESIYGIAY